MNNLTNITNQTPIEIALGIDPEGRTTAKKLYKFLELNPAHYSRWYKVNIIDNQFAEEGLDYEVLTLDGENPLGGRPTQDFKLTASFAKKLSMTQKNHKGEEARNYFIKVEDKLKEVAVDFSRISPELRAILFHDQKIVEVEQRVDNLENTMTIDYAQQNRLGSLAKNRVTQVVGGVGSRAYTYQFPADTENEKPAKLYGSVISLMWHDYRDYFGVGSYKDTPAARYQEAEKYLTNWQPAMNKQLEIERINQGEDVKRTN